MARRAEPASCRRAPPCARPSKKDGRHGRNSMLRHRAWLRTGACIRRPLEITENSPHISEFVHFVVKIMKNRYLFFVILKNHEPWHGAYGPQCLSEKKIMPGHGFLSGNDRPGLRRLVLVLFIALNAFFLSGFLFHVGNRNMEYHDALPRKTLITFLGIQYDAENQSCIEQILNGYSAAHNDMLVSYEGIALNVYSRLLNQRLKKDDRTDNVFILPPDCLRPYQRRGRLADQSGLPALTAYRPEVLGQMQGGGRPYIATSSLGAHGLFVNLDLPARHGVSTPPERQGFSGGLRNLPRQRHYPHQRRQGSSENRSDRREPDAARRPHTGKRRRLSRRAQCLPGSAGAGELPQGRQLRYGTGLCFCPAHARREVHRAFAQSGRHTLTSLLPGIRIPCRRSATCRAFRHA